MKENEPDILIERINEDNFKENFLTTEEASKYIGKCKSTLKQSDFFKSVKKKVIRNNRLISLYPKTALDKYLDDRKNKAKELKNTNKTGYEDKDKFIDHLLTQNKWLRERIEKKEIEGNNYQILILNLTQKVKELETRQIKKPSFWQKIAKKWKDF